MSPSDTFGIRKQRSSLEPHTSLISSLAASAATPAHGKFRPTASRGTFPCGAVACSKAASAARTILPCHRCLAIHCPAMSPPANAIGPKTSSSPKFKFRRGAPFAFPRRQVSAIMSAVTSSNVSPSKKKPGARSSLSCRMTRPTASVFVLLLCASTAIAQSSDSILPGSKPSDAPAELKALVGIYKHKSESKSTFTVLEREGKLFSHNMDGSESELVLSLHMHPSFYLSRCCERADPSTEGTQSFRIKPLRPLVELRNEALNATPPKEKGSFKTPELIELASLDPAFHLDIRYATPNDFLGVPV